VRDIVAEGCFQLLYIDDFCLTVSSTSLRKNCKRLESIIDRLLRLATDKGVQFDPGKTELVHFYGGKRAIEEGLTVEDFFFFLIITRIELYSYDELVIISHQRL
jgi:hypothetical protein